MKDQARGHTRVEKFLHQMAFSAWFPRIPLSQLESQIFKGQIAGISVERPVFIAGLPRAGTTLLLEICLGTNEFASHTYREMPFLLAPLLWGRFSRGFRRSAGLTERVHGDGILVSVDSPESFEEILWKEFWPSYYEKDRIIPWSEAGYPAFEEFFLEHLRKIIHLRSKGDKQARYISKNNLNIARVRYLSRLFPDSTILIPFRSPLQQAASLLRQHRNFLQIHHQDSFARKYMEDTGHFDFGENLRPVNFAGWLSKGTDTNPETLTFWLRYWTHTYRALLEGKNDRVSFFSFDALCQEPQNGLERLGENLGVRDIDLLLADAQRIKKPRPHIVEIDGLSPGILEEAEELHQSLLSAGNA